MRHSLRASIASIALATTVSFSAVAGVPKDLPYPTGSVTADQIMDQVYFVNHFYGFKNYAIVDKDDKITVLVIKREGATPTTNSLERYLNNEYPDGDAIKAEDLAIFRSGKLKGTGMLITDFQDDAKSQSYMIWLPALRKIRRFAEPAHDDAWGGSDFTFGDVTLRKPVHETHELLGKETFNSCLGYMAIADNEQTRYTKDLPKEGSCSPKGKEVYKLKSTTKFENWWYDYRISYVDAKSFADYRSEYFKNGEQVKVIDRDWVPLGTSDDPRAVGWGYWYGKTLATGNQTWAVIPAGVSQVDQTYDANWWSEGTLRKIKR
jgi:hypothetical protein